MTEKLFILGHPVAHSKSPVMYNELYSRMGLDWRYDFRDYVDRDHARTFIEAHDFLSINITTPYKPLAFECADIKAASAKLARGANVLAKKDDILIAYNVDGEGSVVALERKGVVFRDALIVVCGTGPTSLAIVHAAALAGARKIVLIGRDKERTQKILQDYVEEFHTLAHATIPLPALHEGHRTFSEAYQETEFAFGSYETSTQIFEQADIVVNGTPLGMKKGEALPFNTRSLHDRQVIFDVVYGHGDTELLAAARAQGCDCFDGSGMLVAQAVATAKILFEVNDIPTTLSDEEMFAIMARAADFEC